MTGKGHSSAANEPERCALHRFLESEFLEAERVSGSGRATTTSLSRASISASHISEHPRAYNLMNSF